MKATELLQVWGRVVRGYTPSLAIEITRECPLSCPGCYAYAENHLGETLRLEDVRDYKGQELVNGVMRLIGLYHPLQVSFVGGEPLVRYRELSSILPVLASRGLHTQVVTSAVRPIPLAWNALPRLNLVVSVDGLQPEHDVRRRPATYDRIVRHVEGHTIIVHCTITRQMTERPGYLHEFVEFWSGRREVSRIWMSIYTPQVGETSSEIVPRETRGELIDELSRLDAEFPKLQLPKSILEMYRRPPDNPSECAFASTTLSVTADLETLVKPCQLGGVPDCSQCGCLASAGIGAVVRHRLPIGVTIGNIYDVSSIFGSWIGLHRKPHRPAEKTSRPELEPLGNGGRP